MSNLIVDGYNFMHRARSGFSLGENPVVFNFFRNFRALVEMHNPTKVYFVIEGNPKARLELYPEYKANRVIEGDMNDPTVLKKIKEMREFHRQKSIIIETLRMHFPVSVVVHPNYECDDTIYNLVRRGAEQDWIIVSNDSDFNQMLGPYGTVKIYNPMLKKFVEKPDFDYVMWKSLRGDGSDNIPGLPGIGDKTASSLLNDPEGLSKLFEDKSMADQFNKNYELIKFHTWSKETYAEMDELTQTPVKNWQVIADMFNGMSFKSITKEGTWEKFIATFDHLW